MCVLEFQLTCLFDQTLECSILSLNSDLKFVLSPTGETLGVMVMAASDAPRGSSGGCCLALTRDRYTHHHAYDGCAASNFCTLKVPGGLDIAAWRRSATGNNIKNDMGITAM